MISALSMRWPKFARFSLFLWEGRATLTERVYTWCALTSTHIFLFTPVLLAIGIGGYFSLHAEPSAQWIFNLWIGSLACLLWVHQTYLNTNRYNGYRLFLYGVCLILTGVVLVQYRVMSVHAPMLPAPLKYAEIEGDIYSIDLLSGGQGQRIILENLSIEDIKKSETPRRVRIKVRGGEVYSPGQRVKVLAGLNPPSPPVAPYAFDFQRQSYFKQLGAVGFSYRPPKIIAPKVETQVGIAGFHRFWENVRLSIAARIKATVAEDRQGVLTTFLTGEKSLIAEDDLKAMRESGLAHLLAISGLHVGLMAGFVFFLVRGVLAGFSNIALQYPIKKYAAGVALVCAFLYMLLVGASVPTQRAMMMTGIALFAIMIDRSPFSLRMVALAALVILVIYPEALISASFQMSFAAVTALVWFYDSYRPQFQNLYREAGIIRRVVLYVIGIALTTLIAGGATALYGVYHFQSWSVYSMLANILAMPVMGTVVMPLAVIVYGLMPLGLEAYPLYLMGMGVGVILEVAYYVSSLDGAVMRFPAFGTGMLSALTLSFLCLMIGPTILRVAGSGILCTVFFILVWQTPTDSIFIAEGGKLVGIYHAQDQRLTVSSRQSNRYARENWARALGLEKKDVRPYSDDSGVFCDVEGCRTMIQGFKIALPESAYMHKQDCLWADIIISSIPVREACGQSDVIDFYDLRKYGAMKITFEEGTYTIETNRAARGIRPWTQYQ